MKMIIKRFVLIPLAIFATVLLGRDVIKILASQFYLADYRYLEKQIDKQPLKAAVITKSSPQIQQEGNLASGELRPEILIDALKKSAALQPSNAESYYLAGNRYLMMLQKQLRESLLVVDQDGRLVRRVSLQTREIAPITLENFIKAVKRNPLDANAWLQLAWAAGLVQSILEVENAMGSDQLRRPNLTQPASAGSADPKKRESQYDLVSANEIREAGKREIDQFLKIAQWLKPTDPFPFYSAGIYYLTEGDTRFTPLFRRVLELKKSQGMAKMLELIWGNPKIGNNFSLLEEISPEDYVSYKLLTDFGLNRNLIPEAIRTIKKTELIMKKEAALLVSEARVLSGKAKPGFATDDKTGSMIKDLLARAARMDSWNFEALAGLGKDDDLWKKKALLGEALPAGVRYDPRDGSDLMAIEKIYLNKLQASPDSFEAWLGLKRVSELKAVKAPDEVSRIREEVNGRITKTVEKKDWSRTKWGPGNLYGNGTVSTRLNLLEGDYTLELQLKGTSAAGIYPLAVIRLNDQLLDVLYADTTDAKSFSLPIRVMSASHVLTVTFINDFALPIQKADRNLMVEGALIRPNRPLK